MPAGRFQLNYGFTIPFAEDGARMKLQAATELTYTVPGNSDTLYTVLFAYEPGAKVWVDLNRTAVVPVLNTVTSNSTVALNPSQRYVRGGDVLHFITENATADAMVALYVA